MDRRELIDQLNELVDDLRAHVRDSGAADRGIYKRYPSEPVFDRRRREAVRLKMGRAMNLCKSLNVPLSEIDCISEVELDAVLETLEGAAR